jgi:hypothetical protein
MRLANIAKKIPIEKRQVSPTTPVPARVSPADGMWLCARGDGESEGGGGGGGGGGDREGHRRHEARKLACAAV